jgi:hypothetical protein
LLPDCRPYCSSAPYAFQLKVRSLGRVLAEPRISHATSWSSATHSPSDPAGRAGGLWGALPSSRPEGGTLSPDPSPHFPCGRHIARIDHVLLDFDLAVSPLATEVLPRFGNDPFLNRNRMAKRQPGVSKSISPSSESTANLNGIVQDQPRARSRASRGNERLAEDVGLRRAGFFSRCPSSLGSWPVGARGGSTRKSCGFPEPMGS